MQNLKNLFSELGISKVRLAKYLGVSRQMLYNYLAEERLDKWPKEKAKELYIRAKKPKRRSKYSYALILIILRKRGTMKLTMNNNTMGTINPCTNNIQLPA